MTGLFQQPDKYIWTEQIMMFFIIAEQSVFDINFNK
jgi:hypothetical protein